MIYSRNSNITLELINTPRRLNQLLKDIDFAKIVSFDIETTGLSLYSDELLGFGLAVGPTEGFYIPFGHMPPTQGELFRAPLKQLKKKQVFDKIIPFLKERQLITHNAVFDFKFMLKEGIDLRPNLYFDTMVACHILDATISHALENCINRLFGYKPQSYKEATKKGNLQILPLEPDVLDYAGPDPVHCFMLYLKYKGLIDERHPDLYYGIEFPVMGINTELEFNGVRIDLDYLNRIENTLKSKMKVMESKVKSTAGNILSILEIFDSEETLNDYLGQLNLNSHQQLGQLLYEHCGIKYPPKTPKGAYKTDVPSLTTLLNRKKVHRRCDSYVRSLLKLLVDYSNLQQNLSYLTKSIRGNLDPDGKIRTNYRYVRSGRFSSAPNLQNIPRKSQTDIRRCFIPDDPETQTFLIIDYKGQEARLLALLCRDEHMIQAFKDGEDVHLTTASLLFEKDEEDITEKERYKGKTAFFADAYGATPWRLGKIIGVKDEDEIKRRMDRLWERFPGVKKWKENTIDQIFQNHEVFTYWGRRLYVLPNFDSNIRSGVNFRVQGSGADMLKQGMAILSARPNLYNKDLQGALTKFSDEVRLVLHTHDDMIVQVPKEVAKEVGKEIGKVLTMKIYSY